MIIKELGAWVLLNLALVVFLGEEASIVQEFQNLRYGLGVCVLKGAETLVALAERLMDWVDEAFDLEPDEG